MIIIMMMMMMMMMMLLLMMMIMMSHAEPVIRLVFHPYCRHLSDGAVGPTQTDELGETDLLVAY